MADVNKIFALPTCTRKFPQEFRKGRPCLNYYIKQCAGICRGRISAAEYHDMVSQAISYIKKGGSGLVERLQNQMEEASEKLDFEKAAKLRDRIQAIKRIANTQKVYMINTENQDVLAFCQNIAKMCIRDRYIILVALLIVLPLGIGAAVYLTEYATSKRFVALIEFATETLTGIPSILYGLVGMLFFVQFLNLQTSLLAGALTLVIMILPTIIRTTQESLKTVPQSYREGAVGLGAGKWHVIRTIVLPGSIDAVSYTHLDVYKRQKQKSSRRLRKMRKTGMSNARQASSYSEKDGWIVTASLGCTACVNRNSSSAAPFPGRIQSAGTLSQRDRMLFRRCIPISG